VHCCVLDAWSRRVAGWAIDSTQRADLATNAPGMAIDSRGPAAGGIIHGDHGAQFTSWTFTERARKAGLLPSLGTVGDPYDNAVIESFWGRMQTELLNRQRWDTHIELANAIFEYIEGFHNRHRRHSALDSRLDRHGPGPGQADQETQIEEATSTHIGTMPFLWLAVEQRADRGCVERNNIALTSRLADGLDQPRDRWLGHDAARTEISQSGLWNIEHIRHHHEPGFLNCSTSSYTSSASFSNPSSESGR
jgi:hypothetical protein